MTNSNNHQPTQSGLRVTLVAQLVAFATSLVVLAVLGSGYLGYEYTLEALQSQIEQKFELLSRERQARIESYVSQQYERIRLVKSRTRLRRLTEDVSSELVDVNRFQAESTLILHDALRSTESFQQLCVVNLEGEVISSTDSNRLGRHLEDDLIFEQGKTREYFEEPRKVNGAFTSRLSAPMKNMKGELIGVLVVHLNAEQLVNILRPDSAMGATARLSIGRIRNGTVHTLLENMTGNEQIEQVMEDACAGRSGFGPTQPGRHGLLAYWAPFQFQENDHSRWGFVASVDMEEAFVPIQKFRNRVYQLTGLIILFAAAVAYLGARRLTSPLRHLTSAADKLKDQQAHEMIASTSNDEVGDLTIAFATMSSELTRKHEELVAKTVELRRLNQVMHDELELAAKLQEALYPSEAPDIEGFEIHGLTLAAEQLCGDYFDYFPSQNGTFTVALGDVSGHGTGPALLMVETRAIIHSLICNNIPLKDWSRQLNMLLFADSPEGRFVSLFVAQIDPISLEVNYIGAGHNAWIVSASGSSVELKSTGILLGLDDGAIAEVKQSRLKESDMLFIASDGLYETRNSDKELYGVNRLLNYLTNNRNGCLKTLFNGIVEDVKTFGGQPTLKDDLTAVAVRVQATEV